MSTLRRVLILPLALLLFWEGCPLAFAQQLKSSVSSSVDSGLAAHIENVTTDILRKEMEFERWYIQYRGIAAKEPRWRHFRWTATQDAAAGCFLGSQTALMCQSAVGIKEPEQVSNRVQKNATVTGLVGACLEGGSSAVELVSNGLWAVKNRRLKHDPKTAANSAVEKVKEIDALIHQREELVAQTKSSEDGPAYEAEGTLLKTIRDSGLFDYADLAVDARAGEAASDVYYAQDVIGSATYVAGYVLGLKAFSKPDLNGPGYITDIVADCIYIPAAQIYDQAYNRFYNHWYYKFLKRLNTTYYDADAKKEELLSQLKSSSESSSDSLHAVLANHIGIYSQWFHCQKVYSKRKFLDTRRQTRIARQYDYTGPAIAVAFLASDIIGVNTTYNLKHNLRAGNANTFGGLVPTTAASLMDTALTTAWFVGDYVHGRDLRRRNARPEDLKRLRLKNIDEMESKLAH